MFTSFRSKPTASCIIGDVVCKTLLIPILNIWQEKFWSIVEKWSTFSKGNREDPLS